jgi:hypothetical protein
MKFLWFHMKGHDTRGNFANAEVKRISSEEVAEARHSTLLLGSQFRKVVNLFEKPQPDHGMNGYVSEGWCP